MTHTTLGLFQNPEHTSRAIETLQNHGYALDQIAVITSEEIGDERAHNYEEQLRAGSILVAVTTNNANDVQAESILREHHGENVVTRHDTNFSDAREGVAA